ncbi:hypothetical protein [Thiomicrorhabdus sediminis]|uniref:Nickel/cobalt transporter regulator n=1 Tax=Thiomicrorhabdus sediminis TaxID=2580412 RepID=A0A4P9K4D3_9GAMM|nr:hypothetical protein [Thiomicrorhabdus sediminis]QCU89260.1 hypothetical protein FE785_00760 [Thiomicrorhabdus sediminis]
MKAFFSVLLLASASMLLSGCPTYQSVHAESYQGPQSYHPVFSRSDRAKIRGYYLYNYPHMRKIPPGLQKKHDYRFKLKHPLHRDIYYSHLPYEIDHRLPALPRNYIRIRIGDDIAIMNTQTRIIYDAMWIFE